MAENVVPVPAQNLYTGHLVLAQNLYTGDQMRSLCHPCASTKSIHSAPYISKTICASTNSVHRTSCVSTKSVHRTQVDQMRSLCKAHNLDTGAQPSPLYGRCSHSP